MNANDFRTIIKGYHAQEKDVFDKVADNLLSEVKQDLEKSIVDGTARSYFGITKFAFSLSSIQTNFFSFKFTVGNWNLHHKKDYCEDYELLTFDRFIVEKDLNEVNEIAGFQDQDILLLKPLVEALQRRGFECYVDEENYELIVACDI